MRLCRPIPQEDRLTEQGKILLLNHPVQKMWQVAPECREKAELSREAGAPAGGTSGSGAASGGPGAPEGAGGSSGAVSGGGPGASPEAGGSAAAPGGGPGVPALSGEVAQ